MSALRMRSSGGRHFIQELRDDGAWHSNRDWSTALAALGELRERLGVPAFTAPHDSLKPYDDLPRSVYRKLER